MTSILNEFYTFIRSLFAEMPALIKQLTLAVTGSFVAIGFLKMFKK